MDAVRALPSELKSCNSDSDLKSSELQEIGRDILLILPRFHGSRRPNFGKWIPESLREYLPLSMPSSMLKERLFRRLTLDLDNRLSDPTLIFRVWAYLHVLDESQDVQTFLTRKGWHIITSLRGNNARSEKDLRRMFDDPARVRFDENRRRSFCSRTLWTRKGKFRPKEINIWGDGSCLNPNNPSM